MIEINYVRQRNCIRVGVGGKFLILNTDEEGEAFRHGARMMLAAVVNKLSKMQEKV